MNVGESSECNALITATTVERTLSRRAGLLQT